MLNTDSSAPAENETADRKTGKRHRRKAKAWIAVGVAAAIVIVAGAGFYHWHEQPSFCSAICHNMDTYVDTFNQEKGVQGVDKYGNAVADTSAMLSVAHRDNNTTAIPEITCLGCHVPTLEEQMSEGIAFVSGNYLSPLDERTAVDLASWKKAESTTLCANENCHSYLRGSDGAVDREKLEETTMNREFNPHDTHHANETPCTSCHKSHRASVVTCTGCHEHENEAIPRGWLTGQEDDELMLESFGE